MSVSRQRECQLRYQRAGLCEACGKPREHYKTVCDSCRLKNNAYHRKRDGHKPWLPGSTTTPLYLIRERLTQRAVSLYSRGLTLAEVGKRLGVCLTTIVNWLEKAGVPRRRPGPHKKSAK